MKGKSYKERRVRKKMLCKQGAKVLDPTQTKSGEYLDSIERGY